MVIALGQDGPLKGGVGGHVDTTLVGEDPFGILPVGQMRAEDRGNRSIHQLECLKNEGIRGRGGLDMMGEGSVNEVDEE